MCYIFDKSCNPAYWYSYFVMLDYIVEAAVAASPIRAVKGLPLTLAQRLAKVEANKHAKLATRAGTVPPAPRSPKRRGPRLK